MKQPGCSAWQVIAPIRRVLRVLAPLRVAVWGLMATLLLHRRSVAAPSPVPTP